MVAGAGGNGVWSGMDGQFRIFGFKLFGMDGQWGPTVLAQCVTGSLCCTTETEETLLISCTLILKKF